MTEKKIFCDKCDHWIQPGDRYEVHVISQHEVGKPPPKLAAKIIICMICAQEIDYG